MIVLAYESRKCPLQLFDISTPEKEAAAYLRLFKEFDDTGFYSDLEEEEPALCTPCKDGQHKYCRGEEECTCEATKECGDKNWRHRSANDTVKRQRVLYEKALTGDVEAVKRLFKARHDYEYEEVSVVDVIDPFEKVEEEDDDA